MTLLDILASCNAYIATDTQRTTGDPKIIVLLARRLAFIIVNCKQHEK